MCICINCRHMYMCTTYLIIKEQHLSVKQSPSYTFTPINSLIQISISKSLYYFQQEWDLVECLSFTEKPGNWLV
uniref:hypothetical protein Ycf34 n=1 Tax=Gloiopeltis furcata TaxID=42017 RepID=UPI0028D63A2D|nr:hypothetical protein Ycf34 [Gloiopeltis furcata]WMP13864.1 hypothetical protein Ycf34 [Gloiopeltis furcata]